MLRKLFCAVRRIRLYGTNSTCLPNEPGGRVVIFVTTSVATFFGHLATMTDMEIVPSVSFRGKVGVEDFVHSH